METFEEYLASLDQADQRAYLHEVIQLIDNKFPQLDKRIAWSSPTYTDHGTHIISFKAYKNHLAASIEPAGIRHFANRFDQEGIKYGKMNVNFPWSHPLNTKLLIDMVAFNIQDKTDCQTFWRK